MPPNLTPGEDKLLATIAEKLHNRREFLNKFDLPHDPSRLDGWYYFLNATKAILGNFNNDLSFVATLLAKLYLENRFPGLGFDASSKSQSSPGLDIDVRIPDGNRHSGEGNTGDPYHQENLSVNQRATFLQD